MRPSAIQRILNLVVLLPLVLLSVSGGGLSWFRCQQTGITAAEPCCPGEALAVAAVDRSLLAMPADAKLASVECCTREALSFVKPLAEMQSRGGDNLVVPTITVAVGLAASPATPDRDAPLVTGASSFPRPPLILAKRSLLI
jgi:hypothetical protein